MNLHIVKAFLYIALINDVIILAEISRFRKCADNECKGKISEGISTQRYVTRDEGVLSFKQDETFHIYSKDDGVKKQLWGVQIGNIRKFVPKAFIRESKVIIQDKDLVEVPVMEILDQLENDQKPKTKKESSGFKLNPEEVALNIGDYEYKTMKDMHQTIVDKVSITKIAQVDESLNVNSVKVDSIKDSQKEVGKERNDQNINALNRKLSSGASLKKEFQHIISDLLQSLSGDNPSHAKSFIDTQGNGNDLQPFNNVEVKEVNAVVQKEMENDEGNGNEGEENGSEATQPSLQSGAGEPSSSTGHNIEGQPPYLTGHNTEGQFPSATGHNTEGRSPSSYNAAITPMAALPLSYHKTSQVVLPSVEAPSPLPALLVKPSETNENKVKETAVPFEQLKQNPVYTVIDGTTIHQDDNDWLISDPIEPSGVLPELSITAAPNIIENKLSESLSAIRPSIYRRKNEKEEFGAPKPDSLLVDMTNTLNSYKISPLKTGRKEQFFSLYSSLWQCNKDEQNSKDAAPAIESVDRDRSPKKQSEISLTMSKEEGDTNEGTEKYKLILDPEDPELKDGTAINKIIANLRFINPFHKDEEKQKPNVQDSPPAISEDAPPSLDRTGFEEIAKTFSILELILSYIRPVKFSRESPLLLAMNDLDQQQRLLIEENCQLKRKLTSSSNGQIKTSLPTIADPLEVEKLKQELSIKGMEYEGELEDLREKNELLENDLEVSAANEEELNRMVDKLLTNQKEAHNFEESVNALHLMLDGQRDKVENLTSDLAHKTRLNEELRNELKSTKDRSIKQDQQNEKLLLSLEEMKSSKLEVSNRLEEVMLEVTKLRELKEALREEVASEKKQLEEQKVYAISLQESITNFKLKLRSKEAERQVTKECLRKIQLHSSEGSNNVKAELFKMIEVKANVTVLEKDVEDLRAKVMSLEEDLDSRNGTLQEVNLQKEALQASLKNVSTEKEELTSKYTILSKYFDEKLTLLKKELKSKEELLHDADGSAATNTSEIESYKTELLSCREIIDSLKQELEEQKRSHKNQLVIEEKKMQDSWVATRAAERRQEELRQENSQLRQRLMQIQRDLEQTALFKYPVKKEVNGSISSPTPLENDGIRSPPFSLPHLGIHSPPIPPPLLPPLFPPPHTGMPPPMFVPPLPPDMHFPPFMPHLPPPTLRPDRRLPPAGRIASPPGYDRRRSYSPSSESHYSDRYSPTRRGSSPEGRNPSSRRRDFASPNSFSGGHRVSPPDSRNANSRRREFQSPVPLDRHSPNRWFTRSPQGFNRQFQQHNYYTEGNAAHSEKKTSTPAVHNER